MLTPNGQSGHKIEKVMLLTLWAHALKEELAIHNISTSDKKNLIFAGIGKPTYPISDHTIRSYLSYWQKMKNLAEKWSQNPDEIGESSAIEYGDPRGDYEPRVLMAEAMSAWYNADVKPENILFTVGGIGGLRVIFETFNTHFDDTPGYRIITPFPHYSAYSNNPLHRLHPIDVMQEPGYKLTAAALEASIKEAYELAEIDYGLPKAVLLCNPSNPLGNTIAEEEVIKIANVLRQYPDLYIIFDEAYTEMSYIKRTSFLKIAPDLKIRTVIMRSATKALSAAGERMAVLLVFDETLMNEMLNKNISYFIHAPRSAQIAYAQTMKKINEDEIQNLTTFYKKKVDYVVDRLKKMGAEMPDPFYEVEATFYVLGDFKDMFELEMPSELQRVFPKIGKIEEGEELAYYLLFKDLIMITPLSYFGLAKDSGYMRITCSGHQEELKELMDRLENRLFKARQFKNSKLLTFVGEKLPKLKDRDSHMYEIVENKISKINEKEDSCLTLKAKNHALEGLRAAIENYFSFLDGTISST